MDPITSSAAGGMRARSEALELIANNLANATTGGYKADREVYQEYFSPEAASGSPDPGWLSSNPLIESNWTDFSQGVVTRTDNTLDLALSGSGFFVARGPQGSLYTRNGSLHLSAKGQLQTAEGYPLLDTKGDPILLDGTGPAEVSADGTIRQGTATIARMAIVEQAAGKLAKAGSGYFQAVDPESKPAPASGAEVLQGYLEQSNSGGPAAAVGLVGVLRQFEMLQRALVLGNEMNRRAIDEVAKPGT